MPRERDPNRERAFEMYKSSGGKMDLVEIASQLNLSSGTVRGWKSKDKWEQKLFGTFQTNTERSKRKKGGQPGNQNAVGHGGTGPPGNKNAIKHGAYEKIYLEALPEEERSIFESIPDSDDLGEEIRLLRLKLARLISRERIVAYDVFGNKIEREITEAERESGILSVMSELRKLVKTKKQIQLAEKKAGIDNDSDQVDDGFLEALNGHAAEDWADEEEE